MTTETHSFSNSTESRKQGHDPYNSEMTSTSSVLLQQENITPHNKKLQQEKEDQREDIINNTEERTSLSIQNDHHNNNNTIIQDSWTSKGSFEVAFVFAFLTSFGWEFFNLKPFWPHVNLSY